MIDQSILLDDSPSIRRRTIVTSIAGAFALPTTAKLVCNYYENFYREPVCILKANNYNLPMRALIDSGLDHLELPPRWIVGKRVFLKVNLVEPSLPDQGIVTHPSVVHGVAEAFLARGAGEVVVGDGPGHCRDLTLTAEVSGLRAALRDLKVQLVDLNHDRVTLRPNRLGATGLRQFFLPESLICSDIIVSLAKLKTHHWAGVTLAMKNLFGALPGICYGWPKNVLHSVGITKSILDINKAIRPDLAIIDGIVGMEGDGPVMGTTKSAGFLILGANLTAVDATATRLMGNDPWRVEHLIAASGRLGPISERHIEQRGESIEKLSTTFKFPESLHGHNEISF